MVVMRDVTSDEIPSTLPAEETTLHSSRRAAIGDSGHAPRPSPLGVEALALPTVSPGAPRPTLVKLYCVTVSLRTSYNGGWGDESCAFPL